MDERTRLRPYGDLHVDVAVRPLSISQSCFFVETKVPISRDFRLLPMRVDSAGWLLRPPKCGTESVIFTNQGDSQHPRVIICQETAENWRATRAGR